MFVLDETSRPQPNQVLEGWNQMMGAMRANDDRSFARSQQEKTRAEQRARDEESARRYDDTMNFYRSQNSPEYRAELMKEQEAAENARMKSQYEWDNKLREDEIARNPLSRYGLDASHILQADADDAANTSAYETVNRMAEETNRLYADINAGGPPEQKIAQYRKLMQEAKGTPQEAAAQQKINELQGKVELYNQQLGGLNKSGFRVLSNGQRIAIAPPQSRLGALRKLVPDLDTRYPGFASPIVAPRKQAVSAATAGSPLDSVAPGQFDGSPLQHQPVGRPENPPPYDLESPLEDAALMPVPHQPVNPPPTPPAYDLTRRTGSIQDEFIQSGIEDRPLQRSIGSYRSNPTMARLADVVAEQDSIQPRRYGDSVFVKRPQDILMEGGPRALDDRLKSMDDARRDEIYREALRRRRAPGGDARPPFFEFQYNRTN